MFSCEFCEISKSTFFAEHLRTTASVQRYTSSLSSKKEKKLHYFYAVFYYIIFDTSLFYVINTPCYKLVFS